MPSMMSCDRKRKPTCGDSGSKALWAAVIVAVAILVAALVTCICMRRFHLSACCECNAPCSAVSTTAKVEDDSTVTLALPGGVGITKIYASVLQDPCRPIDSGHIGIGTTEGDCYFAHYFPKDPCAAAGCFETALVQPLVVGSEGGVLTFSVAGGLCLTAAKVLEVTVVYCPVQCAE
jgi:hypothetical protein